MIHLLILYVTVNFVRELFYATLLYGHAVSQEELT